MNKKRSETGQPRLHTARLKTRQVYDNHTALPDGQAASVMTPDQSKKLKIGQRVAWHDNATDQGTVTASDWSGVRIAWDNGKDQFFHHNNMTEVEVARANLQ
ncbi:hypothetical protein ACVWZV_000296 [Bradyrhizobium sp. GM5.1]